MNYKAKKILTNWKVILVLIAVVFAIISISPSPNKTGVAIRSVEFNSAASLAGIKSPNPEATPTSREVVTSINNFPVRDMNDYYNLTSKLYINQTISIKTDQGVYRLTVLPETEVITLNETELKTVEQTTEVNKTINNQTVLVNETINITIEVNKTIENILGIQDLGLSVYNAPKSNVMKGLDLQGGTRVLLTPERPLEPDEMKLLLESVNYRLNVYGLSDIVVTEAKDLSNNQYVLVEMPGANEDEVKELLSQQGKSEGKIKDDVIFGSASEIYVCMTSDCSGIDPYRGCNQVERELWQCVFSFQLSLKHETAKRQAEATAKLDVITKNNKQTLSEPLSLYVDGVAVTTLDIAADLKGKEVTEVQISGPGFGRTQEEAFYATLDEMKKMQTIMTTGKLPVKLEIAKTDNISPVLGEEFIRSALIMGLFSLIAIFLVVLIRYRKIMIALPMALTSICEVIILMGVASLIRWNIDLAAIAGIIISIGTGVDQQIVIADETLSRSNQAFDWKKRLKEAFYIIIAIFFTTVLSMIPMIFAGAGLLKGFATTTIMGVLIGVLIARPAYAAVIEILLKD